MKVENSKETLESKDTVKIIASRRVLQYFLYARTAISAIKAGREIINISATERGKRLVVHARIALVAAPGYELKKSANAGLITEMI